MNFFEKAHSALKDFFYARGYCCDFCGREVFEYPYKRLCARCEETLVRSDGLRCPLCGRKTVAEGACLLCKSAPPKFDKGISPLVYRGDTASMVNRIKNGDRRLVPFLAEEMTADLLALAPNLKTSFDGGRYEASAQKLLILAVPMTDKKREERGYNQAELLAERVTKYLQEEGIAAVCDFEVLEKKRETSQQKHLGVAARKENVRGAFHVHKRAFCQGKTIVLIDDIMTTGATGGECARLLKGAGASNVYFLTVAALAERK